MTGSAKYIITFGIKPENDPGRDEVMTFYSQVTIILFFSITYVLIWATSKQEVFRIPHITSVLYTLSCCTHGQTLSLAL